MRGLLIGALALVGYGCTPEEDKPACTADAQCTADGESCVSGACEVVPCEDGDVRACDFDGVAGCRATQRCAGGVYGACEVPEERCNGADDDCDGSTDEDFEGLGDACEDGVGECIDRGRIICSGDGQSTRCEARAGDGGAELCDGFDNDCDGETDEAAGGAACTTKLLGACAAGTAVCAAGDLGCVPDVEPTDEVCDGVDNDCDGRTDEAAAGGPLVEPCYDGPDGTADTGLCATGFRACFGGRFGACEDQALPGAEICDGLDNDCNGEADDGDVECVCVPGQIRPCYTGPEGTIDVGYCQGGEQACAADGSAWDACRGQVVPGVERCDSIDTDCDGAVDELPGVGEPCGGGVGACAVEGIQQCDIGFGRVICSERPGLPGDEVCNGVDDDCNGLVDDVEGAGVACRVGEGACGQAGVIACGPDGALACDAEPGAPGEETCNGIDDDCDGVVDDVEGLGDACEVGVGACRSTGIQICGAGRLTCGAVEQPAGVELCGNNVDDDCDGEVDDADVCSRCGNGERNRGEACDDGNREAGDGCDAECQVEEGFECFDGPADTPVVILGRRCPTVDVDVPDWIGGYGLGYVNGSVRFAGNNRFTAAYAVEIDLGAGESISFAAGHDADERVLEARTAGGAQALLTGRFDRLAPGDYSVRFPDSNCGDNVGGINVEFRTLDLCRPTACDVDADCVFDDQTCFEGECLPADCGDGQRGDGEACDDGNRGDGDGCSRRCEVEGGFVCATGPDGGDDCSRTCDIDSDCVEPGERCLDGLCAIPTPACGDGEVNGDDMCDDGNTEDGDGCAADCTVEPGAVCEDFDFRFGVADTIPAENLPAPAWRVDEDGRGITETANAAPGHYATNLPISPDYVTRFEITVGTAEDDDVIGWTIGGGPTALSAPEQPYLLFSWKQEAQDAPGFGLARAGLRVGQVNAAPPYDELWQATGDSIDDLGPALTLGETGWVDRQTYTVEIVGDSDRLWVYIDGALQFDLEGVGLGDGRLGLYSYSQPAFGARLITPESIQICGPAEVFCGDGEVGGDEECDDGNTEDGDGCAADCTNEPDFTCQDFSFGFGATDTVVFEGAPVPNWGISEDGRTITQLANAQPGHYATELPISPDYRTRFEVGVNTTNDDDQVGWTIGGGASALTAPVAPYLLFSWKQVEQDDPVVGFAPTGLRVGRVDGPLTIPDLWQFNGAVTELAVGATQGELGWVDNQTYTIEIIGDGERLMVYVDGVLEFDLADAPLGDGKLGLYTSSQEQFAATLIAPLTLQVCQPIILCGDGEVGDDEECDDGNTEDGDGCAADCTNEPDFTCDDLDFGLGQTDTFRTAGHSPPVWTTSEDGRGVSQAVNGYPSHYSTDLPISPDYATRFEIAVNIADDDDIIGFAIGGGPTALTAPEQPYLLFSWRGGDALGSPLGDVFAGLRVDRVDGAPSAEDLAFYIGALSPVAEAETLGRMPWAYFETYTVEIVGDSERLRVFVDGVLQFDLADAPIGDGRFGFYTNSQPGFTGRLIAPETLQVCRPVAVEICDNGEDEDGDGAVDCGDPDCVAAPICING